MRLAAFLLILAAGLVPGTALVHAEYLIAIRPDVALVLKIIGWSLIVGIIPASLAGALVVHAILSRARIVIRKSASKESTTKISREAV